MTKLFGTDGIRGTVGDDLTPDLMTEVACALARASRAGSLGRARERPRVVVGRDTRVSGPALEEALVRGLNAAGADALLAGILPTAGVAFLISDLDADAGIVISASHNPPADNGIKLFGPGGWKLTSAAESAVESVVGTAAGDGFAAGSAHPIPDAFERYVDHLVSSVSSDLSGRRVVVDCANGAASRVAPAALERLGVDVVALHADGDGSLINEGCGAMHPEVIAEAAAREGAIGLTFDGDADRVLVADEEGSIIDGDGIIALLATRLREQGLLQGDAIVVTVMSNAALRRWCAAHGISVVETPVGDRHVLQALRECDLVLGGEQAGHIARMDQTTTGDGILVGLGVLDIVGARGERLVDIVPFRPLPQVLVNVRTSADDGIDQRDGVRAAIVEAQRRLGGEGRVLVRPSGTEPLIRVMVEAGDRDLAGNLAELVADAVRREAN